MSADSPDRPAADQLYAVLQYVRPLHRFVAQAVADQLVGTGVSVAARAVMERLHLDGPQTVPQVGHVLSLPRQVIQRSVNELSELGLVAARPNPLHRRSALIALTGQGTELLGAVRGREQAFLVELADRLAADEVAVAERVMAVLTEGFRQRVETARAAGRAAPDQGFDVEADSRPRPERGQR